MGYLYSYSGASLYEQRWCFHYIMPRGVRNNLKMYRMLEFHEKNVSLRPISRHERQFVDTKENASRPGWRGKPST